MTFDLILVGFGNVARRFASLLHEQRAALSRDHDFSTRIVGITTRRHGQVISARGLDAVALADRVAGGGSLGPATLRAPSSARFIHAAANNCVAAARERRLVVVETTTLDIERGEPAIGHVRAAFGAGAHVITANKGPAAFAYRALSIAAKRADRRFLFESAVMDGVPVFSLARETLPAVRVLGFRGVVNSTTNYILTAMEDGQTYDAALAEMQARGIAEADPSLDVDGWDAAAKTAALANVLLGASLTPRSVEREGITRQTAQRVMAAQRAGRRLKLVAGAERRGAKSEPTARVALEDLPPSDLLAGLEGQHNALILHTDLLGEIAIVQRGGDLTHTAYGLLSDLVTIAVEVSSRGHANRRSPTRARRGRSLSGRGRQ